MADRGGVDMELSSEMRMPLGHLISGEKGCLWGVVLSALPAAEKEPDERVQHVIAAELDGELLLVLGVGAEDPCRVEPLTVDRVDPIVRVEDAEEVVFHRCVRDDADLPVEEVVPHDQLEPPSGVDELEHGQHHRLGGMGTDDPAGVVDRVEVDVPESATVGVAVAGEQVGDDAGHVVALVVVA